MQRRYRAGAVSPRTLDAAVANRRSAHREPQFLLAGYVWAGDPSLALACTVRDLSLTGARMELDYQGFRPGKAPVAIPDRLTAYFCPQQIEIDCEVVWRDGRHFGVTFLGQARPSARRFN